MNEDELSRLFRETSLPEVDEQAKARARHRALTAFRQGTGDQASEKPGRSSWLSFALPTLAVFGVALALSLFFGFHPENSLDSKMVQELKREFPDQLAAVVQKGNHFDLVLDEQAPADPGTEVLLTIRQGKEEWKIVAFSGSRIDLEGLPTGPIEVLLSEDGKIIVAGSGFACSGQKAFSREGWTLNARTL